MLGLLPRGSQRLLVQRVLRMPVFRHDLTIIGFKPA
jgi:hypothetical protein